VKLNWSAPKDAVWATASGLLKVVTPQDVYLLLKSSDFVAHDLSSAFEFCDDDDDNDANNQMNKSDDANSNNNDDDDDDDKNEQKQTCCNNNNNNKNNNWQPHLVLRRYCDYINPAGEFRCFVVNNNIVAISQRDHRSFYKFLGDCLLLLLLLLYLLLLRLSLLSSLFLVSNFLSKKMINVVVAIH